MGIVCADCYCLISCSKKNSAAAAVAEWSDSAYYFDSWCVANSQDKTLFSYWQVWICFWAGVQGFQICIFVQEQRLCQEPCNVIYSLLIIIISSFLGCLPNGSTFTKSAWCAEWVFSVLTNLRVAFPANATWDWRSGCQSERQNWKWALCSVILLHV